MVVFEYYEGYEEEWKKAKAVNLLEAMDDYGEFEEMYAVAVSRNSRWAVTRRFLKSP